MGIEILSGAGQRVSVEDTLPSSYHFCRRLARREGGNFYYSFLTLPREKRDAMCVIYAWMRRLDDLSDDAPSPAQAREAIEAWRNQTHAAFECGVWSGKYGGSEECGMRSAECGIKKDQEITPHSLWPAFSDIVRRYDIPPKYFDEIIEGTLMDQEIQRYETFRDLYSYCYRVASVVGLVCLRIFGMADPKAEVYGEALGIAFQLTNILRDVREDAGRGRIYLPGEELKRHRVAEEDILSCHWSGEIHDLFRSFADRAETYYIKAAPLVEMASPRAKSTLKIMTEIYHAILLEIRRLDYRVFDQRARIPTWKKISIVAKNLI